MHMGGYSDLCPQQECFFSCPRQLAAVQAASLGLQSKGLQLSHTLGRVDVWASPPREETDVHILQLSHFSHSPHLIYSKLWVLETLSYYMEYLLERTSTIIPTLQVPFISTQETLKCLALSLQARNERQILAPTVHPDPLPQALPSIPVQALPFKPGYSEKFAQFNYEWQKWWRLSCRLRGEPGAFMSAVHTLPTQSNSFLLFSGSCTPPQFSAWL